MTSLNYFISTKRHKCLKCRSLTFGAKPCGMTHHPRLTTKVTASAMTPTYLLVWMDRRPNPKRSPDLCDDAHNDTMMLLYRRAAPAIVVALQFFNFRPEHLQLLIKGYTNDRTIFDKADSKLVVRAGQRVAT